MSQENLLLVEGNADRDFFDMLCSTLSISPKIQVAPPKDLGGGYNTKQGVLNYLKTILLPQLNDGRVQRLAIVIDADYAASHGLGAAGTLQQIKEIVEPFGFKLPENATHQNGFCFKNSDGLPDFGAWIMPNNKEDGMLEDWIKSCITQSEEDLFRHAKKLWQIYQLVVCKNLSPFILLRLRLLHGLRGKVCQNIALIVY